jgi:putative phosphoesterase
MERLALISDQHANDVAFGAALEDIEKIGVDEIVCLGDVLQGGTEPRQTLERLQAAGCRTVLGNADAFLLEIPTDSPEPLTERQLEVREWTLAELGSDLEAIRSFERVVEVELAAMKLVCFHGSPSSYDDVLLPELSGVTLTPYLEALPADLLAGGHTHRQWTRKIGDALFVNPGSVGIPSARMEQSSEERLPLHAEYALVVVDDLGLSVEFRHAPYAYADLERAAAASGHPHWQRSIADFARP